MGLKVTKLSDKRREKKDKNIIEDKNGWISTGVVIREDEDGFGTSITYSPSGKYALIQVGNTISIVDLLERKRIQNIQGIPNTILQYWYWINEKELSIFIEHRESCHYSRSIYKWNFDNISSTPQLINKSDIPYQSQRDDRGFIIFTCKDSCKMTIHSHDFLLVKSIDSFLVPFNMNANGPLLPLIKLNITEHLNVFHNNGTFRTSIQKAFAYKKTIYFWLMDENRSILLDRFLQIEVNDFDLQTRTADSNSMNAKMFSPRKLNEGSFAYPFCYHFKQFHSAWQEGPMVLFCEQFASREVLNRRIWILNLENETIMEKCVEEQHILFPTLYRGFIFYWKRDSKVIEFKFQWIGNNVPSLTDLCTVKLMSEETVNTLFRKYYDKLAR